jgi:DNA-binding transcriptional regulator YdaS (Cro superfamily)
MKTNTYTLVKLVFSNRYKKVYNSHMNTAIHKAVGIAGGQTNLARAVGVSQPRVWNWLNKNMISPEFVIPVEKLTGVSRHDLRPDIYPKDE